MNKFLVKIKYFLRCEKRKIFSWFFMSIKFVVSFILAIFVPVAFFITFLFQTPREIEVLNRYVDKTILKINPEWNFSYNRGKIGISGLRLVYHFDNFEARFGKNSLSFPNIGFRVRIYDLLRRRFEIDELIVENLESHINLDSTSSLKINEKVFFEGRPISDLVYDFIEYLHVGKIIFRYLTVKNSITYISGAGSKEASKLELRDCSLYTTKVQNRVRLDAAIDMKINNMSNPTRIT
ncbi:MAG: hypothetical protein LBI29_00890, partial [Rickettsiales bacterium]|nr:hypothetical protein [Rickettsiales bacterium]